MIIALGVVVALFLAGLVLFRPKKIAIKPQPTNPLVEQICDSLDEDAGWEYCLGDEKKCDSYQNKALKIGFHLSQIGGRTGHKGPQIYEIDGTGETFETFLMMSSSEILLVKKALSRRVVSKVLSARIELLDKNLAAEQRQELEEVKSA